MISCIEGKKGFLVLLCFVGFAPFIIQAAPTGACSCDGGKAAVEGSHVLGNVVTGMLIDGGFDLVVNGQYKLDPSILTSVEVGKTLTLSIKGGPFRGILLRMGAVGLTMIPATNFQLAIACMESNVAGITHTENAGKSGLTSIGEFRVPTEQELEVDVTVVVSNNANDGSVYYYNSYQMKAVYNLPDAPRPSTISPQSAELEGPALELNLLSATMSPISTNTTAALPAECMTMSPTITETTVSPVTNPPTPAVTLVPTATKTMESIPPSVPPSTVYPSTTPTFVSASPSLLPSSHNTNQVTTAPSTSLPSTVDPMTTSMPSNLPSSGDSTSAISTVANDPPKSPISSGVMIAIVSAGALVICVLAGTFLYYQKLKKSRDHSRISVPSSEIHERLPSSSVDAELTIAVLGDEVEVLPVAVSAVAAANSPMTATTTSGGRRKPSVDNQAHCNVARYESTLPLYKDQVRSVVKPQFQVVGRVNYSTDEIPVVTARLAEDRTQDDHEPDRKPHSRQDP
jgi:hypothetical protein